MYTDHLIKTPEDQINIAQAVFDGATRDSDGYCACPKCGSRNISDGAIDLNNFWVSCNRCTFSLGMTDYYYMIATWNSMNRNSYQLKIIF